MSERENAIPGSFREAGTRDFTHGFLRFIRVYMYMHIFIYVFFVMQGCSLFKFFFCDTIGVVFLGVCTYAQ
jgi:hypothetical protein